MGTYAVSMDCPHATIPDVLWRVGVYDEVGGTGLSERHMLFVPPLDAWTLDTLRMVLHEMAAYLPAHESATVTIRAKTSRAPGRARKDATPRPPRPPRFCERVAFIVSARGWSAEIQDTSRNEVTDTAGQYLGRSAGEWSEPMQAVLLDLAAKSPLSLDGVRIVGCADPEWLALKYPSRRDVIRGIERPERDAPIESKKKRIKRLIDDILGE